MQPHDHETCLPVAGHLRQFLRGIAIHDQRLRTKPERHGRNQIAELVLGVWAVRSWERSLLTFVTLVGVWAIFTGISEIFAAFSLRESGKRAERMID